MNIFKKTVALLLLIIIPQSYAFAADITANTEALAVKNINVRAQAKVGNNRVNNLKKGSTVHVTKVAKDWCQIEYKTTRKAWVYCKNLAPANQASPVDKIVPEAVLEEENEKPVRNVIKYGTTLRQKDADGHWTLGSATAPQKLEEFMDYQCEYCARYLDLAPELIESQINTGLLEYTVYHSPLPYHAQGEVAAEAAFCAGDQGKFWEMHDLLLKHQPRWSNNENYQNIFNGFARYLKLNQKTFTECITAETHQDQIQKEYDEGQKRLINHVSSYFLDGQEITTEDDFWNKLKK